MNEPTQDPFAQDPSIKSASRKSAAQDKPMYFESIMMTPIDRRYAVFSSDGRMLFYTTSVLAARMFMAGRDTNMWSGA